MGEAVDKLAVVAEEEQSGCCLVESADWDNGILEELCGEEVGDELRAVPTAAGSDASGRLVHCEIMIPEPCGKGSAVDGDLIVLGIHPGSELSDDSAVHRDTAGEYDLLALPS